jgi:hypothetical protein
MNLRKEALIRTTIRYCSVRGTRGPAFVRSADLQSPPHKWHGRKISPHAPEVSGSLAWLPGQAIHSPLLEANPLQGASSQSPSGSGFSLPKGPQTRAWRTAVDIFPKMEEFLMNRSSPGTSKSKIQLSLQKAIDGFLKLKTAEGLSQRTITS